MDRNKEKISGKIVDVVHKEIYEGSLFIENGKIDRIVKEPVSSNEYILPGLVNSHVHIESSMLVPSEFARLAVKSGTVATVSDPHEIANVCGTEGLDFMLRDADRVPMKFYFGVPSCVPATDFESAGAVLDSSVVDHLMKDKRFKYLSEMMNFPGVIYDDPEVKKKLESARKNGKPVDGHAPGLKGDDLKKYIQSGISTDHECTTIEEAIEKINLGMKILIREGSAAKNFNQLHTLLSSHPEKVMLCTDDSHPDDLAEGHLNLIIKKALSKGHDLFSVLRSVTVNPKKHYGLKTGLLQAGDPADIIVIDSTENFRVLKTYIDGQLAYDRGEVLFDSMSDEEINNFECDKIDRNDIELQARNKEGKIRVIEAIEGELVTNSLIEEPLIIEGKICSDPERDILKIIVINRYKHAKPAIGFIKNFGIKNGAIGGSIAHDSHNIIAVGTNDEDLVNIVNTIIDYKGGIGVSKNGKVDILPLSVGGIMTREKGEKVADEYRALTKKVVELGCNLKAPFMTLSFMALLVIPSLKLGDKGLFDGTNFLFTSLEMSD